MKTNYYTQRSRLELGVSPHYRILCMGYHYGCKVTRPQRCAAVWWNTLVHKDLRFLNTHETVEI